MLEKHALGIKIIQFTNMNPVFKGGATIIVGLTALLFAYWMKQRFNEPASIWYKVFVALAVFITLYGAFILVMRPEWWLLPY